MTAFLTILKLFVAALPGIALTVLFYEGLPVISRVPYIGIIPIVGDLAVGEKHRYAKEQIRIETAKMVSAYEHGVLEAQLNEERRQRQAAEQITEEYSKRTEAAVKASAEAQTKLEKAIADDKDTDSPPWSDGDFGWLCRNGSRAPECRR